MTEKVESFTSMIRGLSVARSDQPSDFTVPVRNLQVSPFQPRKYIKHEELNALADSIKQNGLINPITVRASKENGKFEIIAGERRYRAVLMLGWPDVQVIVKQLDDKSAHAIALVENLQREDLNPMEEASGYMELLENYALTHEQVAESVGKPRSTISNYIRLLELSEPVQVFLRQNQIDLGHAKILVSLAANIQADLANKVVHNKLSVRQLEMLIKRTVLSPNNPRLRRPFDDRFKDISAFLKRKLGEDFEVSISKSTPNKLSFSSEESLAKFMELLT